VGGILQRISALVAPLTALARSIAGAVGLIRKTAEDPGESSDR
jgi:hypothetical protein